MQKSILTYGAIAGAIVAIMVFVTSTITIENFDLAEILGYSFMIIAFSTIFIAIRSHRDKELNGTISFGKAFQIGLGITLVASVIYIVAWMIISNTIAKDFMAEYYQHSIEQLQASGRTQAEIDEQIAQMDYYRELYKNPFVKIGLTFLEIFPVGFLVSLIASFILKRK